MRCDAPDAGRWAQNDNLRFRSHSIRPAGWPEKPPAALGEGVVWTEPQPYIHIHMALSGGPGRNEEVLVGHLSRGVLKGGMTTQVYELVAVG